jgi:hypothetical protein
MLIFAGQILSLVELAYFSIKISQLSEKRNTNS